MTTHIDKGQNILFTWQTRHHANAQLDTKQAGWISESIHKQNHCYALSYEREIMKPKSFEYFNNNGKYEIVREDRTDDRVRSTLIFREISP